MEEKTTFKANIGEKRTEISSEIEYRKERLELFAQMSASDVAEAPFVYLDRQLVTLILTRIHLFEKILNVHGSIVECGVHRGNSLMLYQHLSTILEPSNFNRKIIGFDTFEGFDQRDINHKKESSKENLASKTVFNSSLESVQDFVGKSALVKLIPGYSPETTRGIDPENQYALVHLDADLYSPQFSGLEYFYPRMTPGGVIIIHDCNNEFTGSKRALNDFFLSKPETPIIIPDKSGSAIVVKFKS